MPKAAVDENADALPLKREIWPTGEWEMAAPTFDPGFTKDPGDLQFGRDIRAAANGRHQLRSLFRCEKIRHEPVLRAVAAFLDTKTLWIDNNTMDRRKWLSSSTLFGRPACLYCGGVADTSDHTPPRCFLPRTLPADVQVMTVPACHGCNTSFQQDELRAAAILCTVSFTSADRGAVAQGGWVNAAIERDRSLRDFIEKRLGPDGIFRVDSTVFDIFSRIMIKTGVGLLFYEFGRPVARDKLRVIGIEHSANVQADAFVECHRRVEADWAEVTPSCRELERQVMAVYGLAPRHMPKWKVYVPGFFEYMFIRRTNAKLLCAMKLHDTLTVVTECPWPSMRGPKRAGKPRRRVAAKRR